MPETSRQRITRCDLQKLSTQALALLLAGLSITTGEEAPAIDDDSFYNVVTASAIEEYPLVGKLSLKYDTPWQPVMFRNNAQHAPSLNILQPRLITYSTLTSTLGLGCRVEILNFLMACSTSSSRARERHRFASSLSFCLFARASSICLVFVFLSVFAAVAQDSPVLSAPRHQTLNSKP
jgi:hypothetical protein